MIKIVSFKICPFVQRVTLLLEAKRIPFDLEYISLKDKPDWFMEVSPNGQVPVLITDSGMALFESDAIVEYIDDIASPLEAGLAPEQRAVNRAWSYQAAKHYLVQCSAMRSADAMTLDERSAKLGAAFEAVERVLGEGPYFNGNNLGNVDLAWLVLLHRTDIIRRHTDYDFLAMYPKVKTWREWLLNTGLAEKSVSEDFEKVFTDFYLSEATYLGGGESPGQKLDNLCATGTCC